MKRFEVYRNIRKRAMIWGLPVSLFALMMIAVVGSLLVIIFSFSLGAVLSVFIFNCMLYVILIRLRSNPQVFQFSKVFPEAISVKRTTNLHYEQD